MRILALLWAEEDIAHIARHGVMPEEVEEVLEAGPLWRSGRRDPKTDLKSQYAFGQTQAGRYLFVVLSPAGHGLARCATAFDMNRRLRRQYERHRR